MDINDLKKFIPLDKSWLTRIGALDIINGYKDVEKFINKQKDTNEDILAINKASKTWKNKRVDVMESATLYRILQFASWKNGLQKVFIKKGSLKKRKITCDKKIINLNQIELLKLDNGTTQWATAAVICGDRQRLYSPPQKLEETYKAVRHWNKRRKEGLMWESKYDITIEMQAKTFLELLLKHKASFTPNCSDDYCFARIFNYIKKEDGLIRWPSLIGHETNRISEVEKTITEATQGKIISTKDHRIIQAIAMWGIVNNLKLKFRHPEAVKKSWPKFWIFLKTASIFVNEKNKCDSHIRKYKNWELGRKTTD